MLLHLLNRLKGKLTEVALGVPRSPRWRALERAFLYTHRTCAACGGAKALQVHHVLPFHLHPELELVESNLVTLCMAWRRECHFQFGHPHGWASSNPRVREDAAEALAHPERREEIIARAKGQAVPHGEMQG